MRPTSTTTTLALAATLLTTPILAQQTAPTSAKRGLAYVETSESSDDHYWTSGDLTWYYNWSPTPNSTFDNTPLQFVPMLFGGDSSSSSSSSTSSFSTQIKSLISSGRNITWILGFNEPDGCSGSSYGSSCLDAQTASEIWIRELEPLKTEFPYLQLGAPAVTSAPTGFTWLQNFFSACAGKCRADFIPVHYYGDFEGFASHVGQVNATYANMSMWVTEWAFPEEKLEETQDFYNQSIAFLDRVEYITHYSYFGGFRSSVSNVGPNSALLTQKGELTDMGAWYLGEAATGNVPKGDASTRGVAGSRFTGSVLLVIAAAVWCMG